MKKARIRLTIRVILLAALCSGMAFAQKETAPRKVVPKHVLLTAIKGKILQTPSGQEVGRIDDLIVDTRSHQVVFAVVAAGRFVGNADHLTAIPFGVLKWKEIKGTCSPFADLTRTNIEMAPKFDHAQLEAHLADEKWRNATLLAFGSYPKNAVIISIDKSAGEMPAGAGERGRAMSGSRWRRASELTDRRIVASPSASDKQKPAPRPKKVFGEVDDLVLSTGSGSVVAVVVSKPAAEGTDRYVVPCAALTPTKKNELMVNKSMDELENAPRAGAEILASLDDAQHVRSLEAFYGVKLG